MPFFNRKELVGEMIESIISNDFKEYELLAVDDGSTPETVRYIETFAEKDSRIRIITRTDLPKGAPTCRNIGIKEAKGEYLIFFDSDDYITPSCLRTRVEAISRHPELDFMVFPSGTYTDGKFNPKATKFVYGHPVYKDDIAGFCRRTLPFVVVNNIYRTEVLRQRNILWDSNLKSLQDCDFNVQCIVSGLRYGYAATAPDYGYRIEERGNAVSGNITTQAHYDSHLHSIEKIYSTVRTAYGNKYDHDLYCGILYLFNNIMTSGINFTFASQLANLICKYSRLYGIMLHVRFSLCHILSYILPPRLARQIPFGFFIIAHIAKEKKLQAKIRDIIEKP